MSHDRRRFLFRTAAAGLAGGFAGPLPAAARTLPADAPPQPPGQPFTDYTPVETPNGASLPWKIVDGVKVFHLVAEPVRHTFADGPAGQLLGLQRPRARARRSRRSKATRSASTSPTSSTSRPPCTGTA
jgi:hypothetical protein